jgi:hypothetical protein
MTTIQLNDETWTAELSGGSHTSAAAKLGRPTNRFGVIFRRRSDGRRAYGWIGQSQVALATPAELLQALRTALEAEGKPS